MLQIVFGGVDHLYAIRRRHGSGWGIRRSGFAHPPMHLPLGVFAQCIGRVALGVFAHIRRAALRHDAPAILARLWSQVDEPIASGHDIQIVLNQQQRMPRVLQLAQRPHQFGDVVKMQARGGFVQQKQLAFACQTLAAGGGAFGSLGQMPCDFQALRLAPAQGGHGLPQLHIVQPHIHQGAQHALHFAVGGKAFQGLPHGQLQAVGHAQKTPLPFDLHLQHLRAVAAALAIVATQIHIA